MSSFFYILIIVLLYAYCFSLQKKLDVANTNTKQAKKENATLRSKVTELNEKANNFKSESRSLSQHIQKLNNHIGELNLQNLSLQGEITKLDEKANNFQTESRSFWEHIQKLNNYIKTLNRHYAYLKNLSRSRMLRMKYNNYG